MLNKKIPLLFGLTALVVLSLPAAFAAQDAPWFDLEKCSMCMSMSAEEGLMEHMEWENYVVTNGMMSVTVVDPDYQEAFMRSMVAMEETGQKLMTGEQMYLCGFCQSYGAIHMGGATFENIETKFGYINLVTSDDPAMVKKIKEHAETTIAEYEKMWGEG